jgi:polysaccharide export outer membrane protein
MPTVTVSVAQINSLVVYVLGNVGSAGPVTMSRNLTAIQAIAMAGGLNEFANRNDIVILRTDADGHQRRFAFRYDDVVKGKGLESNLILQSGDVIYVP